MTYPQLGRSVSLVDMLAAISTLLVCVAAVPAAAGTNVWTSEGPHGAAVSAIAVDPVSPSTIYIGTTSESGTASEGHGVFKSTDSGESWLPANTGLILDSGSGAPARYVRAIAIDPTNPNVLYAGTWKGVFKSTDAGGGWTPASIGLTATSINVIAIDPSDTNIIYAGTGSGVLFKSTDGGGFWSPPAATGLHGDRLEALAIDPATPSTLYASTVNGIFRSADGGESWRLISEGGGAIVIDPTTPNTVYGGSPVQKTVDGGARWVAANTGLPRLKAVWTLAIDPSAPATLYAGTQLGGVYKSADGGGSWNPATNGLTTIRVPAIAVDPSNPAIVYAGTTGGGAFKSTDGGEHWIAISRGLPRLPVRRVATDPTAADTAYATTKGGGVFASTDGGRRWDPVNTGFVRLDGFLLSLDGVGIAVDPSDPATLYAGIESPAQIDPRAFKSTDGGASWTPASTGMGGVPVAFEIHPVTPGTLYALADHRVYKSVTAGSGWGVVPGIGAAFSIALDPIDPRTLFAGGDDVVYRSDNAGASWTTVQIDRSAGQIVALGIAAAIPGRIYAGTEFLGVFVSNDRGASWSPSNSGLPSFAGRFTVRAVLADVSSQASETAYVGTKEGVFRTVDGGRNWQAVGDGAPLNVSGLALDATNRNKLYAGTDDGGVFVADLVDERTATPTAPAETATPTPGAVICIGDCAGTGSVGVNALITMVNIALGNADATACGRGIPSGATVTISMLIQAVSNALGGCGM